MLSVSAERERESEVKIADTDIGLITKSTFCGSGHLEIVVKPNKERSKCTGFRHWRTKSKNTQYREGFLMSVVQCRKVPV